MSGIGKTGINQDRDTVSIWYIYLPFQVDRGEYIKSSYLTGTVTLINDNGEIIDRVKIGRMSLQMIDFPETTADFGSMVICLTAPYSGELFITDVYSTGKRYDFQQENQYRFYKTNGIGIASALIDGKGNILLTVDGDENNGEITINVTNQERTGKLNVNVNGDLLVQNDGTTTLRTSKNILLEHSDTDGETNINVKKDEVKVTSKKILLNDSDEPILLGNKTVQLISDLLDQLGKESAGPYPLLGNAFYTQLKSQLDSLKSTISFVK